MVVGMVEKWVEDQLGGCTLMVLEMHFFVVTIIILSMLNLEISKHRNYGTFGVKKNI
jgi:hypothetical protein